MTRVARVGIERRPFDENDPQLAADQQREESEEERSEPRECAIRQLASPAGGAERSRSSV
jgi:hypothetical protein